MKRFLSIVLSVSVLLFLFTGCGAGSTNESVGETSATSQEKILNTEVKSETKPIEIKFSHYRSEDKSAYAKIYEKFKAKEPNITVVEEIIPSADYMKVLQTRLAGGAAPDIFAINSALRNCPTYNEAGYLEPLNDVAGIQNINDVYINPMTDEKGNLHSIIWNNTSYAMYYNKDLFSKAGVTVPKTWNEFLDVCQKLLDAGITPMAISGKDSYVLSWILGMIQVNDVLAKVPDYVAKINSKQAKFTEIPEYKESISKYETLSKKGYFIKDSLGLSYNDATTLFAQGKAAMFPGGNFTAPTILSANPNLKMGAMNIPGENGENRHWIYVGMTYGVNKASSLEVKNACKTFLGFSLDNDVSRQFCEEVALFTSLKDVELKFTEPSTQEFANLAISQGELIPPFDNNTLDASWSTKLTTDLQGIIAGIATPDDAVKNLDGTIMN